MSYVDLHDLRYAMGVADVGEDAPFVDAINAACSWVDSFCGQSFGQVTEARTFAPQRCDRLTLAHSPIATLTGLEVRLDDNLDGTFETSLAASNYVLLPPGGRTETGEAGPYREIRFVGRTPVVDEHGRPTVQITATWGWPAVPAPVASAARLQAQHVFAARNAPLGYSTVGDLGVIRVRGASPAVEALLAPYRVGWGIA